MPTAYVCETCHQTGTSLEGWLLVQVNFLHQDASAPVSGRVLDATAPDLLFDKLECRQAWCAQASVPDPAPVPGPTT